MIANPSSDNPLGIRGLDFVEFASPAPAALMRLFEQLGFTAVARHITKNVVQFRQGEINFLVNAEPASFASRFADVNGVGVVAIGIRVEDAQRAFDQAIQWGAWEFEGEKIGPSELRIPAIQGIGHSLIYFVDRWRGKTNRPNDPADTSIFEIDFRALAGVANAQAVVPGLGLREVDHLTQVVSRGTLDEWKDFYRQVLHFTEIHEVNANWHVASESSVMVSPGNLIRIPVYEEGSPRTALMHSYLHEHAADGVQHVALSSDDIFATVDRMKAAGLEFVQPPEQYYASLDARLPGHGLDVAALKARQILVDGEISATGEPLLFLQTFVRRGLGEMAIEIVERRGHHGFGEGNLATLAQAASSL
jgi:4-hydroxyphenylpyruvate dioxygenase